MSRPVIEYKSNKNEKIKVLKRTIIYIVQWNKGQHAWYIVGINLTTTQYRVKKEIKSKKWR